mmetsp:Transcript_69959/g.226260  ORF Transcript_69959/g.226260 Transcript_69959/m.226260 type:complete len:210 (+) Transcript_69959:1864-2493(+)
MRPTQSGPLQTPWQCLRPVPRCCSRPGIEAPPVQAREVPPERRMQRPVHRWTPCYSVRALCEASRQDQPWSSIGHSKALTVCPERRPSPLLASPRGLPRPCWIHPCRALLSPIPGHASALLHPSALCHHQRQALQSACGEDLALARTRLQRVRLPLWQGRPRPMALGGTGAATSSLLVPRPPHCSFQALQRRPWPAASGCLPRQLCWPR